MGRLVAARKVEAEFGAEFEVVERWPRFIHRTVRIRENFFSNLIYRHLNLGGRGVFLWKHYMNIFLTAVVAFY
jgi:hypothetical protein